MDILRMEDSSSLKTNSPVLQAIRQQIEQQARILSIFIEKSNSLEHKVFKVEENNKELNDRVHELKSQLDKSQATNASLQNHVAELEAERADLLNYIEVLRDELKGQRRCSVSEVQGLLQGKDRDILKETTSRYAQLVEGHKKAALEIANALKTDKEFLESFSEEDVLRMIEQAPTKMQQVSRVVRRQTKFSLRAVTIGVACGVVFFTVLGVMALPMLGISGIAATCLTLGAFAVGGAVTGASVGVNYK